MTRATAGVGQLTVKLEAVGLGDGRLISREQVGCACISRMLKGVHDKSLWVPTVMALAGTVPGRPFGSRSSV